MKKNQIFACALFMGIALGACTEDYTDWANPPIQFSRRSGF